MEMARRMIVVSLNLLMMFQRIIYQYIYHSKQINKQSSLAMLDKRGYNPKRHNKSVAKRVESPQQDQKVELDEKEIKRLLLKRLNQHLK